MDIARLKYLPDPRPSRRGVALCLSGGGFRAALFHLGALRRLNELRVLSRIDTITSVSGGSIIAAQLANCVRDWPEPGSAILDWDDRVDLPFRRFVGRDIRTEPVLRRLLPWNWFRSQTQVNALAEIYARDLTPQSLDRLPIRPRFVICATDM